MSESSNTPTRNTPSQADEFLRRSQAADAGLSESDFQAHESGTYYRKPPGTGRRDVAVTMSNFLGR
ncbi:hypothetical protein ACWGCW_00805 [Streptomyces sp. NPDC054933]